jgi:amidase
MMPGDPYTAPPPSAPFVEAVGRDPGVLRVGVMRRAPRDAEIAPECVQAVDAMAKTLADLGHHVEQAHPAALDEPEAGPNWFAVVAVNTARTLAALSTEIGRPFEGDDLEPLTWEACRRGSELAAPNWLETVEFIHAYGRRLRAFWYEQGFDLLLSPTQAALAPELGYVSSTVQQPLRAMFRSPPYGTFTLPMNLSGQPALSLPTLLTDAGMPVGTQLAAEFGREDLLLSVAAQVERARPWAAQRPPGFG